jgi:hypothetical protein
VAYGRPKHQIRQCDFQSALSGSADFELKGQAAEFFAYVRAIETGIIQVLEVRGGMPFCMEVAQELH